MPGGGVLSTGSEIAHMLKSFGIGSGIEIEFRKADSDTDSDPDAGNNF
jgi:hypothetical protein